MKRLQIGLIALVLLVSAAFIYLMGAAAASLTTAATGLLRVGLVMAALWLAMPTLAAFFIKTPRWMLIALVAAFAVFALQPKLLWWIPVLMLAIWFVWSRFGFGQNITGGNGPPRLPRRPKRKA